MRSGRYRARSQTPAMSRLPDPVEPKYLPPFSCESLVDVAKPGAADPIVSSCRAQGWIRTLTGQRESPTPSGINKAWIAGRVGINPTWECAICRAKYQNGNATLRIAMRNRAFSMTAGPPLGSSASPSGRSITSSSSSGSPRAASVVAFSSLMTNYAGSRVVTTQTLSSLPDALLSAAD